MFLNITPNDFWSHLPTTLKKAEWWDAKNLGFCFFGSTGVWTQGLKLARQMASLGDLSHVPQPLSDRFMPLNKPCSISELTAMW
jgi:hypothetical protein